jgi:hypothetical protein
MNKEISILDLAPISENMPTLNRRNEEVNYPMSDPDEHEFDAKQTGKTLTERIKARNVKEAIGLTSMPIGSVPGAIEKQVINYGDGDQEASDSSGFGKSSPMDLPEDQPPVNIERKDSGTSEYNVLGNPTNNKDKSKEVFFSWLGFGDESRVVTSKENKMNKELNKLALALNNSGYAAQSNMIRKMAEPTLHTYGPQEAPQNAASAVGHKENAPDTIRPAMRDFFAKTKAAVESDDDNLFSGLDDAAFNSIGNALLSQYDRGALQDWRSFADTFGEQCQRISHTNNDADVKELIDFLFKGGQNPGSDSAAEYNNALTAANALQHAYQSSMSSYSALRPKMIRKMAAVHSPVLEAAINGFLNAARAAIMSDNDNLFAGSDRTAFESIAAAVFESYRAGLIHDSATFESVFEYECNSISHTNNDADVKELIDFLFKGGQNPGSDSASEYNIARTAYATLRRAFTAVNDEIEAESVADNIMSRVPDMMMSVDDFNVLILLSTTHNDPWLMKSNDQLSIKVNTIDSTFNVFSGDSPLFSGSTAGVINLGSMSAAGGYIVRLSEFPQGAGFGPMPDSSVNDKIYVNIAGQLYTRVAPGGSWAIFNTSPADDHIPLGVISSRVWNSKSLYKAAQPVPHVAPTQAGSGGGSGGGSAPRVFPGRTNKPTVEDIQLILINNGYLDIAAPTGNWRGQTQTAWSAMWSDAANQFHTSTTPTTQTRSYFSTIGNDATSAIRYTNGITGLTLNPASAAGAALNRLERAQEELEGGGSGQLGSTGPADAFNAQSQAENQARVTDAVIMNFFGNKAREWPGILTSAEYPSLHAARSSAVSAVIGATNLSEYLDDLRDDYIDPTSKPFGMHIFGRRGGNNGGIVRFIDSWMQNAAIKDDIKKMILAMDKADGGYIAALLAGHVDRVDTATQNATATARQTAAKIQAVVERLVTRDTIVALVADINVGNEDRRLYSLSDLSRNAIDMSGRVISADGGGLVKVLSKIAPYALAGYETLARDSFSRWLTPGVFGKFYPGTADTSEAPEYFSDELTRAAESTTIAAILQAVGETSLAGRLV